MCITFIDINPDNKQKPYKFLLGFNRDEALCRPTLPINPFEEDPNIIAGRDVIRKGTWLGFNTKTKIIAILTNFHTEEFIEITDLNYGRGFLPLKFLNSDFLSEEQNKDPIKKDEIIQKMANQILSEREKYNAFNLIIGNLENLNFIYFCNRYEGNQPVKLPQGSHALCNSDYFTIWEKTEYGHKKFREIIDQEQNLQHILKKLKDLMLDQKQFEEDEQEESSIFVKKYKNTYFNNYRGTIQSTFITLTQENKLQIEELIFTKQDPISQEFNLNIQNPLKSVLEYQI